MAKVIGLTGGIGSGKTTIAHFFSEMGVPVYISDDRAKKVMQSEVIVEALKNEFGSAIFDNSVLNRAKLADIVFKDKNKLSKLNAIVHPAVKKDFSEWLNKFGENSYIVYESAILFESGKYLDCDCIISVIAPEEIRIQRVIRRDNTTRENVIDRMKMQWNDEERSKKSNFIINNLSLDASKAEIVKILKILNITQNHS